MEMYKAEVTVNGESRNLELSLPSEVLTFPLTEDVPNEIKAAFNKLIMHLKVVEFQFKIENAGTDLFSQVATEYVAQLNKEIKTVYAELKHHGLLKEKVA